MPEIPIFAHLTVNAEGVISLWDSAEQALKGKAPNEVYVELPWIKWQHQWLEKAKREAQALTV